MGSRTLLQRFAPPVALIFVVFALYAQTAGHEFVAYDSSPYLTGNAHVQSGLSLDNLRWALTSYEAASWHPLTWLSHMLDIELFGLAPAGHLLENAGWHAANALLVLALFESLGLGRSFAFAGALIFAIHPLRAESVAWAVERKDLLCAFFGLSSLLAWLSWRRAPSHGKLLAALALYACSLMSKSMLVTLPCLMLLLEWWPLGRTSPRLRRSDLATLACLGMAFGTCILALQAASASGAVRDMSHWPAARRLENALDAYAWYLTSTFWPTRLACLYPWNLDDLRLVPLLLDLALLLAISAAAWIARRRLPGVLVGWLWFVGTLVPVIGIVQVGVQAHADRFSYFPSLGLIFALCHAAERELLPRLQRRGAIAGIACLAAIALGLQSWRQIATWRSTETLALRALEVTRENSVANDMLGAYYTNTGRVAEALPFAREAVRIAPADPNALMNLGGTLLRHGDLQESEQVLLRASSSAPRRWQTWSLLGGLYLAQQRYEPALTVLDRALAIESGHAGTWTNRGRALEALGRLDEARASFERAGALGGTHPEVVR